MGVLPCQFPEGVSRRSRKLDGSEILDLLGLSAKFRPRPEATLIIHRTNGEQEEVPLLVRIDAPIEVEYYSHGGILPYVPRQLLRQG
jgi:aconitate hydratase